MAEEKKKPEKQPEQGTLKLGWKWHVKALAIIYAVLFLLLIVYIVIMGNLAVKNVSAGVDYLNRVAYLRALNDENAKLIISEKYKKIDDYHAKFSQLVKDIESTIIVLSCNDTDVRNLNNIKNSANESYNAITDVHKGAKLSANLQQALEELKTAKINLLKGVEKNLSLKDQEIRFFQERGYVLFDLKEYKNKLKKIKGIWNDEEGLDVAAMELQRAISNDNKCVTAYYYLAKTYQMQGLEDDAVEKYAECVKASKINLIERISYLFVSWPKELKEIKPDIAIEELKTIKKEKESAGVKYQDVYYFLGEAYYAIGLEEAAKTELTKALEIDKEGLWSKNVEELLDKIKR